MKSQNRSIHIDPTSSIPQSDWIPTRSGDWTIRVPINGTTRYLASTIDPYHEADCWLNKLTQRTTISAIILLGVGAGHGLARLLKSISFKQLIIIEKDPILWHTAIKMHDLAHIETTNQIQFLIDNTLSEVERFFNRSWYFQFDQIILLPHPVLSVHDPYYTHLQRHIADCVEFHAANIGTQIQYRSQMIRNIALNLSVQRPIFSFDLLENTSKDCPAIVVGAGPSLDNAIPFIKEIRHQVRIIATDSALPALCKATISPDIIVSIDYSPNNWRHFESVITDTQAMVLIATVSAYPKIIEQFAGNVILCTPKIPIMSHFCQPKSLGLMDRIWSSTSLGVVTARWIGASPILFVGQDLSFPNNRVGANHTIKSKSPIDWTTNPPQLHLPTMVIPLIQIEGNQGPVWTTPHMKTSLQDLNSLLLELGGTYYNLSYNGAKIYSATQLISPELISLPKIPLPPIHLAPRTPDEFRISTSVDFKKWILKMHQQVQAASQALQTPENADSRQLIDKIRLDLLSDPDRFQWIEYAAPDYQIQLSKQNMETPSHSEALEIARLFFEMIHVALSRLLPLTIIK